MQVKNNFLIYVLFVLFQEINDGKFDGDKNYKESCYDLFLLLNSIKANLNNIASNSSEVNGKITDNYF